MALGAEGIDKGGGAEGGRELSSARYVHVMAVAPGGSHAAGRMHVPLVCLRYAQMRERRVRRTGKSHFGD